MLRALPSVFCRCIFGGRSRRRHDQDRPVAEFTGQAAEAGMYTVNGAKLAIEDIDR